MSHEIKIQFHRSKYWAKQQIRGCTRPVDDLGMLVRVRQEMQGKAEGGAGRPVPRPLLVLYQEEESVCWALMVWRLTRPKPTGSLIEQWLPKCASGAVGVLEQLLPGKQIVGSYLVLVCSGTEIEKFPPAEQIVKHLPPHNCLGLPETLSGDLHGQIYLHNNSKLSFDIFTLLSWACSGVFQKLQDSDTSADWMQE